ncbi:MULTISPECIES: hypothetical protein [unclassified Frondihabitans]|uniref:hypothetical protein n=1 Tax=unclassified Frondihabitans TaxID=2626248 RepID=UPI000F4E2433|nr:MULTISPECIES: hypothetical protein [unclassified Frondihabitans]
MRSIDGQDPDRRSDHRAGSRRLTDPEASPAAGRPVVDATTPDPTAVVDATHRPAAAATPSTIHGSMPRPNHATAPSPIHTTAMAIALSLFLPTRSAFRERPAFPERPALPGPALALDVAPPLVVVPALALTISATPMSASRSPASISDLPS